MKSVFFNLSALTTSLTLFLTTSMGVFSEIHKYQREKKTWGAALLGLAKSIYYLQLKVIDDRSKHVLE